MANDIAYLIKLAAWLGRSLAKSRLTFAPFNTRALGIALPDNVVQAPAVTTAVSQLNAASELLEALAQDLETHAEAKDQAALIATFIEFGSVLIDFFRSMADLESAIKDSITPATIPEQSEREVALANLDGLAKGLTDFLLAETLTNSAPIVGIVLNLLGLLDWRNVPADPSNLATRTYILKQLHLSRFKDLIKNPVTHFQDAYGWGSSEFDPTPFFNLYLDTLSEEADFEVGTTVTGDPFMRHGSTTVSRASNLTPPGLLVEWDDDFNLQPLERVELNENWGFTLSSDIEFEAGASAQIEPVANISLLPPSGSVQGNFAIVIDRNPEQSPFALVGGSDLIQLSAENTSFSIGLTARWDTNTERAYVSPLVSLEIAGGVLSLGSEDADSFVGKLLGNVDIEGRFDIGLEFSPDSGLVMRGAGGIEIALPLHQSLGLLELNALFIALLIGDDGTLSLETSTGLTGQLGPLKAAIERVGAELNVRLAEDVSADFGPFDLDLAFKPPSGVGLSVDAGVLRGGGYLYIDTDRGEYAGVLELSFLEFLTLTAIAVITTKMPDGSKGFSLIAIINVAFNPGLQLGFGFTLLGVGGLLGLNRTMDLDALAEGVRTGSLNSVLFPSDVVANAARIISDMRAFFPPEEGTFLIGPMAKFGWGTPTLISLALGIIIEVPGNIAIVGTLKVALPEERVALILIQVAFIGAIEFDKKRVWFFANLYDSRVLYMPLEGGMGVLAAFGNDPNFVVSVGGFHPDYNPPSLPFKSLNRIAINILNTPVARIRIDAYFAVTANTVQFGARAELFFGIKVRKFKIGIEGHIAFDALFQFSPFYFIIEISASLSVKVLKRSLLSVRFRGSLEGTSPWHIQGTGSIRILRWDLKLDFSRTWGDEKTTTLPPISVMPILASEFAKLENWTAKPGKANNNSLVSLRSVDDPDSLILHPVGSLTITQRAVPLNLTIDKLGNQRLEDANRFTITAATEGIEKRGETFESFAIAQFQTLTDADKLSVSDYEKEEAGIELSITGQPFNSSFATKRVVRYEQIVIDNNFKRAVVMFFPLFAGLFAHFLNNNAVTQSLLSAKYQDQRRLLNDKIAVKPNGYIVANVADNRPVTSATSSFASRASAKEFINSEIARDPTLTGQYHIIRPHEMAEVS